MGASKDRLKIDLAAAMRAKDEAAKSTIRMVLAAIKVEEVAGEQPRELSDAEELAVIHKELSKRRDSAETYSAAGRQELAAKEYAEADLIAAYLPAPLTPEELQALVDEAFAELAEPATMRQMGVLVKSVTSKADGRAEGKEIAALVKKRIAG